MPAPTSRAVGFSLAVIAVVITTVVLNIPRDQLETPVIALLYLLPVVLSTAVWGLGPGITAAFFAFLAFNYFFIPPYYTLVVHQTQDVLVLAIFFVVAIVISQLVGRAKSSLAEAQARERETTHLYELSVALAGLRTDDVIGRTIVERLYEVFRANTVEIMIQPVSPGAPASVHRTPFAAPAPTARPDAVVPLMTARGLLGEIRLWRPDVPLTPSEDRLLRTFASQGALALERALLGQVENRAKVLEESDRLKTALLSSVSHELRTPLATIKAASTSLRSGEVTWQSQARDDLIIAIDEEADHLNRLVGNLLDMSRIEAGALKPQRQWNILAEIVAGVLARLKRAAEGHTLAIDIPDSLPLVPVDYVLMEQVFINLIGNSLKYAPANTTIHVSAVVGKEDPSQILVRIENQGPSVPEEHLDRIFDKFYRVTAADRITGTGLGLSICKGIVEVHGGRIWAENLPGGFAFNFTLPLTWQGHQAPTVPEDSETL